jgi:L-lysine exporter family protein LysE/ArgO
MLTLLAGLGFGLSLIVAIGAQNAFVLRQGLRREHVGVVAAICAVSDAVLYAAGGAGFGPLVERWPDAVVVMRWLGAAVVLGYGAMAAWRAVRGDSLLSSRRSP